MSPASLQNRKEPVGIRVEKMSRWPVQKLCFTKVVGRSNGRNSGWREGWTLPESKGRSKRPSLTEGWSYLINRGWEKWKQWKQITPLRFTVTKICKYADRIGDPVESHVLRDKDETTFARIPSFKMMS